jgi:hypothetical protein
LEYLRIYVDRARCVDSIEKLLSMQEVLHPILALEERGERHTDSRTTFISLSLLFPNEYPKKLS